MTSKDRSADPSTDAFKYTLIVNDHHDPDDGICHYPRYGWACLSHFDPDMPVCDANPYPEVYIQEQTFTMDDYVESTDSLENPEFPIANPGVMYPHQIRDFTGWEEGPTRLFDFIETVRDNYYEHGLATLPDGQVEVTDLTTQAELDETSRAEQLGDELPVRVITNRTKVENPGPKDYDENCEIYFRNGANDVEYLMWNSDELYGPADNSRGYVADSELIQTVLTAFAQAYEEPETFLRNWQHHAVNC